ncbi:NUDIX domain-containing protein [Levilactobacillus acidifarinae]|uniref:ADP-ribose pyrophosphatase n=1 Tax=Levilactobacillus acidifarinae DSM 19394 = JCM 15949 TaxID=1423715 RepID=A0A0R1LFL5_9LACO|nr:NUDIX domain-containing protein [Levilactobacillus acidifarinae]KRK94588.1 ADP-ribose pyrophosphatase [Levilactobacillus acidifarinae DSM 19394]GEO68340.1 phosphohydrolase [Levilactobacillus acidifarinae]
MGYVLDLRQTVGARPLIVVGEAALVVQTGQLLLVKRRDNGLWGLPAGSKELNESLATTAQRELREETGLIGQQPKLLGVTSGPHMQYQYPNGDQIDSVTATYALQAIGQPRVSNETSEVRLFDWQQLPTDLTPITRRILNELELSDFKASR